MTHRIVQWIKCVLCGKLHATAGMSPISVCKCGNNLWVQLINGVYAPKK